MNTLKGGGRDLHPADGGVQTSRMPCHGGAGGGRGERRTPGRSCVQTAYEEEREETAKMAEEIEFNREISFEEEELQDETDETGDEVEDEAGDENGSESENEFRFEDELPPVFPEEDLMQLAARAGAARKRLLKSMELTENKEAALRYFSGNEGSIGDFHEFLGGNPSTAQGVLWRLAQSGLVVSCRVEGRDGRLRRYHSTEAGVETLARLDQELKDLSAAMVKDMTEEEQKTLRDLLLRAVENLEQTKYGKPLEDA